MSSSVVPGRTRQSISTVASPGMTLYFTPAWMIVGLTVSRRSARTTRACIGSQRASSAASPSRGSSLARARRSRACSRVELLGDAASRNVSITGVGRGGPWTARRVTAVAGPDRGVVVARHRAVAPRPVDGQPVDRVALLGDADRVEARARERRRDGARFVDRGGRPEELRAARR